MKIIFNSSMPRSGSQLLQNILAQNPRFSCSSTSGLLELLFAARANYTQLDEFKNQPKGTFDKAWNGFCRGGLEGWCAGLTDKPVICDKSRGWIAYYGWLSQFYTEAKVIVCVRDLRAVISSMEKLQRKNAHLSDPGDQPMKMQGITIEQRVGQWLSNAPVGLALNRLRDAIHRGNDKHFHFVIYEHLMATPDEEMAALYKYLDEENFVHDFKNIEQSVDENDALHGAYGDHKIRPKLEMPQPDWNTVLGKPLAAELFKNNRWYYERFYPEKL
jgi:sulfotransferase